MHYGIMLQIGEGAAHEEEQQSREAAMTKFTEQNQQVSVAQTDLKKAVKEIRVKVKKHLTELDPADPQTLPFAVEALVIAGFEQKELAELIGVSRTTIGRWGQGQNIPRAPAFRKFAVETFKGHLKEAIAEPDVPEPVRPLPRHAADYTPRPRRS